MTKWCWIVGVCVTFAGCGTPDAGVSGPADGGAGDANARDGGARDVGTAPLDGGASLDGARIPDAGDAASMPDASVVDARVITCTAGAVQSCYGGPAGTAGVGACMAGTQTCAADGSAFGACMGAVDPVAENCATAADDDCDGTANEADAGCGCVPGSSASCYGGPAGTLGVGACHAGSHACSADGLGFGACAGDLVPVAEDCATSIDDDCDGTVDEGCTCTPGAVSPCYSGAAGTAGVGPCHAGTHTCAADGSGYGACTGEVVPVPETCTTPIDDDCNGMTNEGGVGCACLPNSMRACYTGPAGTSGIGACHGGIATCSSDGTTLGACTGQVVPVAETCTTPVDDDCNGMTNEGGVGCVCAPNATQACYTGPAGTRGVGACHDGTAMCDGQGTTLGACTGQVVPVAETCTTPVDDDCDGMTNESGTGCVCLPGSSASCYTGPAGTNGVGLCHGGTHTCDSLGTSYGTCMGQVTPVAENCSTPGDDDCDGSTTNCGVGYAANVQPILAAHCAPCHTSFGNGGTNLASSYADTQFASFYCTGHTEGYCALVRIQNGTMPQGAGCTGNPATDAGNAACLTAAEQQVIANWITGGQLP